MPSLNKNSLTPVHSKTRWKLSFSLVVLAVAAAGLFVVANPSEKSQAAPFPSCETRGILFQYPNGTDTDVHLIDMVTGNDTTPNTISGRTINAIGYNVVDNFVYGWDNTANTLVRVHADFGTVEEITITGYSGTANIIIGDVDENGDYWFIEGSGGSNGQNYYQVDVSSGGSTATITSTGTTSGIPASHSAGADWAYVPGGSGLYRVMHDQVNNQGHLLVFDRSTGAFSSVGLIPQSEIPSGDLKEGAFYADSNGFLYASDNDDGNIYRVNVQTADATLFASGPAASANDGARCANASIPTDFADAPSLYSTLLADDGPRHSVIGFNVVDSTSSMMLGKKLDIETDGFPGAEAHGDDENHDGTPFIDDEDGVQHIVATPGTPTAFSIPVTVTNNTSDTATLAGWIDLDGSNSFDAGERVTTSIPANSGTGVYELNFPETTFTANTFARFRVFDPSVADPQPTGSATGGEVEDYLVQVGTYEVEKTSTPANGSTVELGDTVEYMLTINNTGLTDLVNLTIHDDLSDVLDDASLVGDPVINPSSAGSAVVDNDELEFVFTGDVLTGQTVTVSYSVKISDPDNGNHEIGNHVIAAHSNCHPGVEDGQHTVPDDPACQTSHQVLGLANTGGNMVLPIALAGGLLSAAGAALYFGRKHFAWRGSPAASQK